MTQEEIPLFKIALKFIQKGYTREDLKYSDDLYDKSKWDIDTCLEFYDEIVIEGTRWAVEVISKHNQKN